MPRKNAFRPARLEGAVSADTTAIDTVLWRNTRDHLRKSNNPGTVSFDDKYPEAEKVSRGPLGDIVETFKAMHPELWEQIRLGPTQHGLQQMIEVLDA